MLPDLDWPLMRNNITRDDLGRVIEFLSTEEPPILTQSTNVRALEEEWSQWLGVRHSVFVNSGSSANLITLHALRERHEGGEVIVPPLTWSSDVSAVLHAGFDPVFVDIDRRTLGMDNDKIVGALTDKTRAVFLTHILGYNALSDDLLAVLEKRGIPLIEDVCESHGAEHKGRRLGSLGFASNFSFYYAHHMSTIEGGMVCTNDSDFYELIRMARSHGMVREIQSPEHRQRHVDKHPDLNPAFIFSMPGFNVRSTEINAVIGRSQLPRLDANNTIRTRNLLIFLENLDPARFQTDFAVEESSNYAFTLILKEPDENLRDRVEKCLATMRVECRRGTSGGGNQLRQPYLRKRFGDLYKNFPLVDHVHFFGFYIGNYPDLETEKIHALCRALNAC